MEQKCSKCNSVMVYKEKITQTDKGIVKKWMLTCPDIQKGCINFKEVPKEDLSADGIPYAMIVVHDNVDQISNTIQIPRLRRKAPYIESQFGDIKSVEWFAYVESYDE